MTSRYSSRVHCCLVFLVSLTLLVFITKGPLLGEGLVWANSGALFTGDFNPVADFSTPDWLDTEGRAPCSSTRRAMWHDLFRPFCNVNTSDFQVSQTPVFLKRHHLTDGTYVVEVQDLTCFSLFPVLIDRVSL